MLGLIASIVLLPAAADAAKKPKITSAAMQDRDADQHADAVLVGWSTKVKHRKDADGRYPLTVAGYTIQSLPKAKGAKEMLVRGQGRVDEIDDDE